MLAVLRVVVLAVIFIAFGAWYAYDVPAPPEPAAFREVSTADVAVDTIVPDGAPAAPASARQAERRPSGWSLLYDSALSADAIVALTNAERRATGLAALTPNSALAQAALAKAEDILARGYFEHIAPDGTRPADLALRAGYPYILIGENLALGEFKSSEEVVAGWMESTEHRENILHERYRDIGVALLEGEFEGEELFVAVQEFGMPRSACPELPTTLGNILAAYEVELDALRLRLNDEYAALDATEKKYGGAYGERVDAYNAAVEAFNWLLMTVKDRTVEYNDQVRAFNVCVEGI
ncbi:CAP domain-containing protein [Candidatus Wolfebacteria bacterium]|nr:CAP domain-containing protein [Candidatus Wolfebacteria bacterium]